LHGSYFQVVITNLLKNHNYSLYTTLLSRSERNYSVTTMISLTTTSNVNENEGFQTPSKKRSKEGEKEKKSKRQKVRKETTDKYFPV